MFCVAAAALAGCSQSHVANDASSHAAPAPTQSDHVLRVSGPAVLALCSEVLPAAMQYYATCQAPVTEASTSMSQEILCIDLVPERLAMYPQCAVPGGVALPLAPPVAPEDINAYADSVGNLGVVADGTYPSESQLSSVDGTKTATQTSGGITVSVNSGSIHPSLPRF